MKNPKLLALFFTGFLATIPHVAVAQSLDQFSQQSNATEQAGKYSQAESIWRRLIQLNPNNAKAYNGLGNALRNQKKFDDAIAAYRKALQLPEDNSGTPASAHTLAYNNLGNALSLQPNTEVNQLRYNSYGNILSLCLEKINKSEDLCLQNNISRNQPSQSKAEKLGQLHLELGGQPLKVNIEDYYIAQLGKKDSPDNPNPLEFVFTPEASQLELNLTPPTSLYISLPKLTSVDSSQWLRGNLEVENVKFSHPDQTGNVGDEFEISTILQGKIPMAEQELEIKPNQFLITGKPGIQLLDYLQIQSKPPQGLLVRFSGNSESIEAGLDPKFIVDSIRPSFLAKYLCKDAITVLLSFCAAVAGSLLPLLFAKSSESNSKP